LIDLKRYRVVDLSQELHPGIRKVSGEYVHGEETRRLEIRQFVYAPDKMLMHWVDTETHIGTHVEGPSHYADSARTISELPLETFMGEAVLLNLAYLKPKDGEGQPIRPSDLERVRKRDIVLMWSPYQGEEAPYISPEAAKSLQERGIKMLGIQGVGLEPRGSVASHELLLKNEIPIVERLDHLDRIRKERFFFIGLPIKISGIDSSWIRAVALEEL